MKRAAFAASIAAVLSVASGAAAQTPTITDVQPLIGSPSTAGDFVGSAVSVSGSGNTVAVGSPRWGSTVYWSAAEGAVYVFERDPSTGQLVQQARITRSSLGMIAQPEDHFGSAVAISDDGDTLVVGAPN